MSRERRQCDGNRIKGVRQIGVLKNQRGEQKLEVVTKAIELAAYSVNTCKSEKNFPKKERWIMASRIANLALDIVTAVRKANDVRVSVAQDYLYRRQLQIEASGNCEAMLTLIELAHKCFDLETRKTEYWVGMILELEKLISKWRKSDRDRFGSLLK